MIQFEYTAPEYPVRRPEVIEAAVSQLRTGGWTRLEGAPELEADLAAWHGEDPRGRAPIPWFVSSGTAALEAIMLGHGIGPGDEVITTPYTWGATVSAILAIGAIPVFTDIDPISARMCIENIPDLITSKTKAVLTVHLFGHPVDCAGLRKICDDHKLFLFEDASQAHGARFNNRLVGDWGDAAALSCMGMKLLAGTEGGYALFRDPAAAEVAYLYGKHPRGLPDAQAQRLENDGLLDALQLGWRCSAVAAVLLQGQLKHLESENAARRHNAAVLRQGLADCDALTLPEELPGAAGCYHLLSLVYNGDRTALCAALNERNIDHFIYIPTPIHRLRRLDANNYDGPRVLWHDQLLRAGVDYRTISLPGAEKRSQTTFEMGFNWTEPNDAAMQNLAAALKDAVAAVA